MERRRRSRSPLTYNGVTIKVEPTSDEESTPDTSKNNNVDGSESTINHHVPVEDKTWHSERNLKAKILMLEGENGLLQDRLKRLEHKFKELSEEHEKLQKQYEDMKHVNLFLQKALFKDVTVQVKDSSSNQQPAEKHPQPPEVKCVPLIATKNSCLAQVAVLPANCNILQNNTQNKDLETTIQVKPTSHERAVVAFSGGSSSLQIKAATPGPTNRQLSYMLAPRQNSNVSSSAIHIQELPSRTLPERSMEVIRVDGRPNAPQDLMDIGGGVFVPKAILNPMTLLNYKKLTRILLCTLFPRKDLAECSVTGRPSNAHRGRYPPKRALDPHKVSSITGYVKKLFPQIKASMIRQEMALKLKEIQRFTGQRTRLRNHSMFWTCPPIPIKKEPPETTPTQEPEPDPQDMEVEHITVCPNIEPLLGDQSDSWNEGSDS